MKKQLRIISRRRIAVCPYSGILQESIQLVSRLAFSKHAGRQGVAFRPHPGVQVLNLPCGNYLWRYPSGRRMVSALPF